MKCPHCGAEVKGNVCEYCGSQVRQPHKATCPECGGQHVKFSREWDGTVRIPIGICQDCGYEWDARSIITPDLQMKIIFFLFGFVLCFPVPVTYLLWKTEKLSQKAKYILIGLLWAAYLGIFILPQIAFFIF